MMRSFKYLILCASISLGPAQLSAQPGNVGIGTNTPAAKLHVQGDMVAVDSVNLSAPIDPPVSGAGTRMMWYGDKAAFRAGHVSSTQWNKENVGFYSVGIGVNTLAKGMASTALGSNTTAVGEHSTAIGYYAYATGDHSTAIGSETFASGDSSIAIGFVNAMGDYSTAMGFFPVTEGDYSTAIGYTTYAAGDYSTALGSASVALGMYATALGSETNASGLNSTALGANTNAVGNFATAMGIFTSAVGNNSTAMGHRTIARSYTSTAIGRFNVGLGDSINWISTDPVFEIGIGSSSSNRANAVTVLKNGSVGIGTTAPTQKLHVVGNAIVSDMVGIGTTNPAQELHVAGNVFVSDMVGIGTSTPAQKLHVVGTAAITSKVGIGTISPNEEFEVGGNGRAFFGNGAGADRKGLLIDGIEGSNAARLEAYDYSTNTGRHLVINTVGDGNVGINTPSPAFQLEVGAGDAAKPGGGFWLAPSDLRLKQDVAPYDAGLAEALQIRPVRYHYNESSGYNPEVEYVGVIAQELQQIAPGMVSEFERNGETSLAVDSSPMLYMLINAVKELHAENQDLRSELVSLQASVALLEAALSKQE